MVLELLPRAREKVRTAWAMSDPVEHMEWKDRGQVAMAGDKVVLFLVTNIFGPEAVLASKDRKLIGVKTKHDKVKGGDRGVIKFEQPL